MVWSKSLFSKRKTGPIMDSNSEDREYHSLAHAFPQDAAQYKVTYTHRRTTHDTGHDKNEDFDKKRYPAGRSGNNPSKVKRVVSCKRKSHHLMVARRKPPGISKTCDAANKENEMNCLQDMQQEIFDMDPWEFPLNVTDKHRTGEPGFEQDDYCTITELQRDHSTLTDVLYGRNLRLRVSLTLWQRNVGELLTYLLRIQDKGVLVDFLPLISKSIDEVSPRFTIGCCVDLFPLVKEVLTNPYEEYLIVGLTWIKSVLIKWSEELRASGSSGLTKHQLDKNFQVFNQQLLELWHQEPSLKSVPGPAGDLAKVIDSFLSQLT